MQHKNTALDYLSVLEFRGHDAGQFLHGQLSADVSDLTGDSAGFACVCNPAGRVLGLLLCRRTDDGFLAVCAADLSAVLHEWLTRFVLRARVDIRQRPDLGVCGLVDKAHAPARDFRFETEQTNYWVTEASEMDTEAPGTDRMALIQWRREELAMGVAWLNAAASAQFLPQMLGFEKIGALSYNKGCFPGQEVIARTHYLGKLKRRPLLLRVAERVAPPVMTDLVLAAGDETATAVVVDRVAQPGAETLILVVVRADPRFRAEALEWQEETYPVVWSGPPANEAQ